VVAHLVRLKLHLLRNGLRRSVAALVGMVLGLIYGGGFVVLLLVGLITLRAQSDLELSRTVLVVGGSALVASWALLPIILFGVDPTLDPTRFATFAIRERTLAVGLVLTALIGLPGVATVLLVLGSVVAGSRSFAATLVAVVGGLLGLLTCVLLSRIVTGAAAAVASTAGFGRRSLRRTRGAATPAATTAHAATRMAWDFRKARGVYEGGLTPAGAHP
jgi:ABC-2 type transport system permease protein